MGKRLLELSTVFDRPTVCIDGIDYEVLERADLSITSQMRLWALYARVMQVRAKDADALADTDGAVLSEALDGMLALLMPDLPAAVRTRLRESQKLQILADFTEAAVTETEPPPESQPTTVT